MIDCGKMMRRTLMENEDNVIRNTIDDDDAWTVVPRTNNLVLRFFGNVAGSIGGRLLDFYLNHGDRYEMNLDYVYGGDMIPLDNEFESWMKDTTDEIFDSIDKKSKNA